MLEDLFITFIASFLIWFMFAGLFVLWIIDGRVKKEQVLHALLAAFAGWLISEIVKSVFNTKRPFVTNGGSPATITTPQDAAFPSGHSTAAFALAVSIWLHDKKIGAIYMVSALLVALGRILANVHYPLDIVVGALIGTLSSVTFDKVHLFSLLKKTKAR
jgi:undecaprenyl-diphosphatase